MSVSVPTKTQGTELLAHTQQATAVVTLGTPLDVSTMFGVNVFAKMGRTVATALTNEVLFRIEGSAKSSGNDEWFPIYEFTSENGTTTCNASTLNDASFNAADTSFTITSPTGMAPGDNLYFRETGTPADSEWSKELSVSGSVITLEEAITRGHTNGITITDLGEIFQAIYIDCSALGRIRFVCDTAANASGQTVDVIAWAVSLDSVTTT